MNHTTLDKLIRDEHAATLAEYALTIGLVAAVVVLTVNQIGAAVGSKFQAATAGVLSGDESPP